MHQQVMQTFLNSTFSIANGTVSGVSSSSVCDPKAPYSAHPTLYILINYQKLYNAKINLITSSNIVSIE